MMYKIDIALFEGSSWLWASSKSVCLCVNKYPIHQKEKTANMPVRPGIFANTQHRSKLYILKVVGKIDFVRYLLSPDYMRQLLQKENWESGYVKESMGVYITIVYRSLTRVCRSLPESTRVYSDYKRPQCIRKSTGVYRSPFPAPLLSRPHPHPPSHPSDPLITVRLY